MADDDLARHAQFAEQGPEAETQRLHAHQVDFLAEQPARVIFAKARRLHQRTRFVGVGVGGEIGLGQREHAGSGRGFASL